MIIESFTYSFYPPNALNVYVSKKYKMSPSDWEEVDHVVFYYEYHFLEWLFKSLGCSKKGRFEGRIVKISGCDVTFRISQDAVKVLKNHEITEMETILENE